MDRQMQRRIFYSAGAMIAFLIGCGFSSGQEVMQFFTSYGPVESLLGGLLTFALFIWFTARALKDARRLRLLQVNEIFKYYCGDVIGTFFNWLVPVLLFMIYMVMLSGAGALLNEYYGLPNIAGRLLMAGLTLLTVLLGLNGLVQIIGRIGPVIILFIIGIGMVCIFSNTEGITNAAKTMRTLPLKRAAPWWWLSATIYASFSALTTLPFLAGLGRGMPTDDECVKTGILGSAGFMGAAMVLSFGMLAYITEIYNKNVPAVYIADQLLHGVGIVFSIVMFLGIYTTAVPMLWSSCSRISNKENSWKFRIAVLSLTCIGLCGSGFPFASLVNIFYPYMGYIGLLVFGGMLLRQVRGKRALPHRRKRA